MPLIPNYCQNIQNLTRRKKSSRSDKEKRKINWEVVFLENKFKVSDLAEGYVRLRVERHGGGKQKSLYKE